MTNDQLDLIRAAIFGAAFLGIVFIFSGCEQPVSESTKAYYKLKADTYRKSIDTCFASGGIPRLSAWDSRYLSCETVFKSTSTARLE